MTSNSFVYYGNGLRRSKIDSIGTTNYYYDGGDILGETNGAGQWRAAYIYGALGLVSERLNPDEQLGTAESLWYHTNFIGSVHALTDATGVTVEAYDYDAYGIPLSTPAGVTNPFRYVGQSGYYKDPDHSLMMLGARYYEPYIGRFISQDPIGYEGGLDLYAYVGDNPVSWLDPSGLERVPGELADETAYKAWFGFIYRFVGEDYSQAYKCLPGVNPTYKIRPDCSGTYSAAVYFGAQQDFSPYLTSRGLAKCMVPKRLDQIETGDAWIDAGAHVVSILRVYRNEKNQLTDVSVLDAPGPGRKIYVTKVPLKRFLAWWPSTRFSSYGLPVKPPQKCGLRKGEPYPCKCR